MDNTLRFFLVGLCCGALWSYFTFKANKPQVHVIVVSKKKDREALASFIAEMVKSQRPKE